jgi:heptosyltransferase-1
MRIAIVKLSALGDIVHAMVVLQFVKKLNKKISIDWIVDEDYKKILSFHPDINKIYILKLRQIRKNKSLFALINELQKIRNLHQYDLVIDLQGLIKSAIISKLIPSKKTIGFDRFSSRESFSSFFYNKTFKCGYDVNVIERNLALVGFALGTKFDINQINNKMPFLHSRRKELTSKISVSKKNILLIPGASNKSKRFPSFKLAEISKLIDANFLVVWGSHDEEIIARKIKEISPIVNICDRLELDHLISLISRVDLVIGSDTGPTHFAWALNIPSITIFGPTPGYRNTWATNINRIVESDSVVDPYKIDKKDFSIRDVNIDQIINVAKELLDYS